MRVKSRNEAHLLYKKVARFDNVTEQNYLNQLATVETLKLRQLLIRSKSYPNSLLNLSLRSKKKLLNCHKIRSAAIAKTPLKRL